MSERKRGGLSDKAKAMLAAVAPKAPDPKPKEKGVKPTPEQMRRGHFERESVKVDGGQVNSVAYRRHPRFETMAKQKGSGITRDQLDAMTFYRDRHEESAMSLTKCALDIQVRGAGVPSCLPPGMAGIPLECIIAGSTIVERLEAAIGNVVDVMRAIVLEDKSISDVAVERFGGRKQRWILPDADKKGRKLAFVEKIVPKSGRHRAIIRDEFLLGLERLTAAVRQMTTTAPLPVAVGVDIASAPDQAAGAIVDGGQSPNPIVPIVDPEFLDEKGQMRPLSEIAEIILQRHSRAA